MNAAKHSSSAAATLDALARELQQLPIASLAPALVLLLSGLLLLVAGRHFLRPVLVMATIGLGALLGVPLLGPFMPRVGGVVLTILGGALGLLIVAVAWRVMVGAATGIITAFACGLIAMMGVDAGFVDARSTQDTPVTQVRLDEVAAHDELLQRVPTIIAPLVMWADARWQVEPPQVRTLLTAAAACGAFIGFVLGTWLIESSAAMLTSLMGALFTLVGAMPFLARMFDRAAEPVAPVAWLLLWAALALAGWLLQTSRRKDDSIDASTPRELSPSRVVKSSSAKTSSSASPPTPPPT